MSATVLTVAPSRAVAQDNAAIAESLFVDGRKLMGEGKYAEALPKLEQSLRLDRKVGTLLNVAVVQEKLGRTASAWASYRSVATLARRNGQGKRETFAREKVAELEPKLSRVTVQAAALSAGAVIELDGVKLDVASAGAPMPLDPGPHRLVVSAVGKKSWDKAFEVPEGPSEATIQVPALEDEPVAAVPPPEDVTVLPPPPPDEPVEPADNTLANVMVYGGFGLGGAGLLLGAITGGMALSQSSDLSESCPDNQCPEEEHDSLDAMTTLSHVSTAGFVIGGVGVAAGVVGLFLMQGDTEEQASWTVVPTLPVADGAPGGLTFIGSF